MTETINKKDNRKRNSIIAIILTIAFIFTAFMITFLPKTEKTQADIINEKLRKQDASWVAKNYPKEILDIPMTQKIEELMLEKNATIDDSQLFNEKTKEQFFPDNYSYDDLNCQKKQNTKNSGFFLLPDAIISSPIYELEDQINWMEYLTKDKDQLGCGSCNAFAMLGALEGYVNRKEGRIDSNKLNLSEQYVISYINFMGCDGAGLDYYIKFISLNSNSQGKENDYLKNKIKNELRLENKLIVGTKRLQTRTQLSLDAGEAPFGIPLENQLKYLAYDSCEIGKLNKTTGQASTGMQYLPLLVSGENRLTTEDITTNFCPDTSDVSTKLFIPVKNDWYTKYFIENHFKIDNSDCKTSSKTKTINNIKEALKLSPLATSVYYYESMGNFESGIWEKLSDENMASSMHGVVIVGWGVDKVRNREYWILKNNWGDTWGNNGYFRVWIGDNYTNLECSDIYGFSGNLVSKPGKEINDLLPIARQELSKEKLAEAKKEAEQIMQEQIENKLNPIETSPYNLDEINPLNGYNIINISYRDMETLTDSRCISTLYCIYDKLYMFYGHDKTQENKPI